MRALRLLVALVAIGVAACSGEDAASPAAPAPTPDADAGPGPAQGAPSPPASDDASAPAARDAAVDGSAPKAFTVLPWWDAAGIPPRVVVLPNEGQVIGIHSSSNDLVVSSMLQQSAASNASWTLGIREVEPYEYDTDATYRAMVARLVHEAETVTTPSRPILMVFNTGQNGSHDPMTTLPGASAPTAAADLRALLAAHPGLRLSMEVYCSGAMTAAEWHARLLALKGWAQNVGIARARVTVNEDISNTTATSGESYGTLGHPTEFDQLLVTQANDAKTMGFGGVDYICSPPTGAYPTLPSTFDTVRTIYQTDNVL